ncbi:hypothetical protein, partial [Escherichia coli]|uniref:hypothetical protein n=1 Tax=Escherichia coli TaxID=562 RepID=UPI0020239509
EQMALLTGDIVWLVNTTVTLPDGSTQTVQVPQVYARVKPGDVNSAGALIAGRDMALSGKEVSITAATDQHVQAHTVEQKTSGLTLALSGTAGSALNTT